MSGSGKSRHWLLIRFLRKDNAGMWKHSSAYAGNFLGNMERPGCG